MQTKFLLSSVVVALLNFTANAQYSAAATTTLATSTSTYASASAVTPPPTTGNPATTRTPNQSLAIAKGDGSYFNALTNQADYTYARSQIATAAPTSIILSYSHDFYNIVAAFAVQTPTPTWFSGLDSSAVAFMSSVGAAERSIVASGLTAPAPTGIPNHIAGMAAAAAAGVVGVLIM